MEAATTSQPLLPIERRRDFFLQHFATLWEFRKPVIQPIKISLAVLAWFVFLLGWHFLAKASFTPDALLPTPGKVLSALVELFANRGFGMDVLHSLRRIAISFGK